MSAPPGVASPGYVVTLNGRDKGMHMHYNTTYHSGGDKRLDGHFQSNGWVIFQAESYAREGWSRRGLTN